MLLLPIPKINTKTNFFIQFLFDLSYNSEVKLLRKNIVQGHITVCVKWETVH